MRSDMNRSSFGAGCVYSAVVLATCLALFWIGDVAGQEGWGLAGRGAPVNARLFEGLEAPPYEGAEAEAPNSAGPLLPSVNFETDLDTSTYMSRAEEFGRAADYNTAAQLVQKVLDAERQILVPAQPGLYSPSDRWAVDFLLSLPPEALDAYRSIADPQARALFSQAQTPDAEALLRETAERFFLSSVGDDAAFQLACRHLTRGEFSLANRWLEWLIELYPDSDIPDGEIWLRAAVAAAALGNESAAERRIAAHRQGTDRTPTVDSWLRGALEDVSGVEEDQRNAWPMPWGGPRRDGVAKFPSVDGAQTRFPAPWVTRWVAAPTARQETVFTFQQNLELLLLAWGALGRTPSDTVLFEEDRVYLSNSRGVRCFAADGFELWADPGSRPFNGLTDSQKREFSSGGTRIQNYDVWTALEDRLEGRASIVGDTLYRIEGSWASGRKRVQGADGRTYREFREGSRLAAYNKKTGQRLFRLGGGREGGEDVLSGARFLNAPLPCDRHLLVACEQNDSLHLVALHPESGEVLWQRTLCSYTSDPTPPSSPVGMLVNGGTVYLAPGRGVVFALDGYTGSVEWAALYRSLADTGANARFQGVPDGEGWEENALFVQSGRLLVLPTDAPAILGFDLLSGTREYRTDSQGATHALGVHGGVLVATSEDRLLGFDAANGTRAFETTVETPTGRGLVAERSVLLPYEDRIDKFALSTGKRIQSMQVGTDGETPLGNLISDGRQVYAGGLGYLFALTNASRLDEELNAAIQENPGPSTYLARGVFNRRTRQFDDAIRDLRKAQALTLDNPKQRRMAELRQELANLDQQEQDLLAEDAWFNDDFDRPRLGADYSVVMGNADIKDGTLHMNAAQNMLVRLNKEIPGDFRVTVTGWQPESVERLCDLSFKMDVTQGGNTLDGLYVQFGTNWNVRNKIQISGRDLDTSTNYLMKPGVRHNLELVRLGARTIMLADGVKIIDHSSNRVPHGPDAKTTLHLYGFGGEHYYDNLTITLLNADGTEAVTFDDSRKGADEFKRKLGALNERRRQVRKQMVELREAGYAGVEPVREALFRSLMEAATEGVPDADSYLEQASKLAAKKGEVRQLQRATAEARIQQQRYDEAVDALFAIAVSSRDQGGMMRGVAAPGWKLSPDTWVRLRLEQLLAAHGDPAREALQQALSKRLETMLASDEATVDDAYRVMIASLAVPAAARAGLIAARLAEVEVQPAKAELIYYRMMDASDPAMRRTGLVALAKFAERRGWPAYAHRTWQTALAEAADKPTVLVAADPKSEAPDMSFQEVELVPLCRQAMARLSAAAGETLDGRPNAPILAPPLRLQWTLKGRLNVIQEGANPWARSRFTREHLFLYDFNADKLRCLKADDGTNVWTHQSGRRYSYLFRAHAAFSQRPDYSAVSLLTGKRLWNYRRGGALPNSARSRIYSASGGVLIASHYGNREQRWVAGIDAVTGETLWSRTLLETTGGLVPDAGPYVIVGRSTKRFGNSYESTSMLIRRTTGEVVNPRLRYSSSSGRPVFTPEGIFAIDEGTVVMQDYESGDVLWRTPLGVPVPVPGNEKQKRAFAGRFSLLPGNPYAVIHTPSHLVCVDIKRRKRLWTLPLADLVTPDVEAQNINARGFAFEPANQELLLTLHEQVPGGKRLQSIRSLDIETGAVRLRMRPRENVQWSIPTPPVADADYLLAHRTRMAHKDGRARVAARDNVLINRESGKVVPKLTLPPDLGKSDKSNRLHRPLRRGKYLLFDVGGEIRAYKHSGAEQKD